MRRHSSSLLFEGGGWTKPTLNSQRVPLWPWQAHQEARQDNGQHRRGEELQSGTAGDPVFTMNDTQWEEAQIGCRSGRSRKESGNVVDTGVSEATETHLCSVETSCS